MKVLHLISGGDKGGAKTHLLSLLCGLKELISVKLVCFMEGDFSEEMRSHGVDTLVLSQKSRFDMSVLEKLKDIVVNEKFDLVHCHGARANFIGYLLKKKVDVPFLSTIHSDYELDFRDNFYKNIIFKNLNKFSLKAFDYYIAISDSFKDMLIKRGFPPYKLFTAYNGILPIDDYKLLTREEYLKNKGIEYKNETVVGILARLDKVKDHETFIKAAYEVLKQDRNFLFLIAGDGSNLLSLKNLAAKLKIEDKLIFIGEEKRPYDFLNCIDINTLTSLSESFPYAIMEGALLKKPIIASRTGGMTKIALDGLTGYTFTVSDHMDLKDKILKLASNKEDIKVFGENIYKIVMEKYSSKAMAESHIEIYQRVLEKSVIISGYFGFSNSGDDAILKALVESIRKLNPYVRISVLSKNPEETRETYKVFAIDSFNIFKLKKGIKENDMLIFGGGSLLQDTTSSRSIWYYLYVIHTALKYKKKIFIYSNGVGPINSAFNRRLSRKILDRVDYITLRDDDSLDYIREMGVKNKNVKVLSDPVFNLKESSEKTADNILKSFNISSEEKLYGINIRQWKNSDILIKDLSVFIKQMSKKSYKAVFLPMHFPNDLEIINKLTGNLDNSDYYIIDKKLKAEDMMAIIKKLDFTIAMRFHMAIYSIHQKIPVIALSYDPKTKALMKDFDEDYCINVLEIKQGDIQAAYKKLEKDMSNYKLKLEIVDAKMQSKSTESTRLALSLLEDENEK